MVSHILKYINRVINNFDRKVYQQTTLLIQKTGCFRYITEAYPNDMRCDPELFAIKGCLSPCLKSFFCAQGLVGAIAPTAPRDPDPPCLMRCRSIPDPERPQEGAGCFCVQNRLPPLYAPLCARLQTPFLNPYFCRPKAESAMKGFSFVCADTQQYCANTLPTPYINRKRNHRRFKCCFLALRRRAIAQNTPCAIFRPNCTGNPCTPFFSRAPFRHGHPVMCHP